MRLPHRGSLLHDKHTARGAAKAPAESGAYTVNQAAAHFGVHHHTVRNWIADGKLKAYRVGGRLIRIRPEDLELVATECEPTSPEAWVW